MNFNYFINRPVFAWVISIIMILVGSVCYFQLSVREYPQIADPVITIETKCGGYSAEAIEEQVTKPLEDVFSSLEGLKDIHSASEQDNSRITIVFNEGTDINAAYINVLSKANQIGERLPRGYQQTVTKADVNSRPIMYIALSSDESSPSVLYDYSVKNLESQFASVDGVATVHTYGGSKPEMHLVLDIHAMTRYGISADMVVNAVHNVNINQVSIGKLRTKEVEYSAKMKNDLSTLDEFNQLVVHSTNGQSIKLSDVGHAEYSHESESSRTYFNGKRCVLLSIVAQPTANPVSISKLVNKRIKDLRINLPKGMSIEIADDRSTFIENSIKEVWRSIFEAIILVAITIFLFLRSFRASVVPLVTIPICLISTFAIIKFFGFTINTLTLLALVLGVGLLVDDAIVVVENIYRYIEEGDSPYEAAVKGFSEISSAVIAMTFTLAAVYIPVVLSSGITGKLFKEFALTLAGCVIISGFVAVTLSPMMCSRLLIDESGHIGKNNEKNIYTKYMGAFINKLAQADTYIASRYGYYLDFVFRSRKLFIIIASGLLSLSILLFKFLPTEFSKKDDQNYIWVRALASTGDSLERIHPYMWTVYEMFKNDPNVDRIVCHEQLYEESYLMVGLVDSKKRKESCFDLQKKYNDQFRKLKAGVEFYAYCPAGMLSGGDNKDQSVVFYIQTSGAYDELISAASTSISVARSFPFVIYADWNLPATIKEYEVIIDHEKASYYGITNYRELAEVLNVLVYGRSTTTFSKGGLSRYPVRIIADERYRKTDNDLLDYSIRVLVNNKYTLVRIRDFIDVKTVSRFPVIMHESFQRALAIHVHLDKNKQSDLKKAYFDITEKLRTQLPESVSIHPGGDLKKLFEESNSTILIFVLALLFVFLIMAAQFESFISPLIVMFTVPFALSGAMYTLFLLPGGSFNIFSNIGLITLIGLVTKHGILIVDFANSLFASGKTLSESITESCRLRLRPILMTTFAMVIGSLPLALATGPGSAVRRQLGWVIVGGMSIGTLFTVFFLPLVYLYIKPLSKDYRKKIK